MTQNECGAVFLFTLSEMEIRRPAVIDSIVGSSFSSNVHTPSSFPCVRNRTRTPSNMTLTPSTSRQGGSSESPNTTRTQADIPLSGLFQLFRPGPFPRDRLRCSSEQPNRKIMRKAKTLDRPVGLIVGLYRHRACVCVCVRLFTAVVPSGGTAHCATNSTTTGGMRKADGSSQRSTRAHDSHVRGCQIGSGRGTDPFRSSKKTKGEAESEHIFVISFFDNGCGRPI